MDSEKDKPCTGHRARPCRSAHGAPTLSHEDASSRLLLCELNSTRVMPSLGGPSTVSPSVVAI